MWAYEEISKRDALLLKIEAEANKIKEIVK
jgi:hypothetical protein